MILLIYINTTGGHMEKKNTFKEQRITTFLKKYGNVSSTLNLDEKIKLCPIDDFNSVA